MNNARIFGNSITNSWIYFFLEINVHTFLLGIEIILLGHIQLQFNSSFQSYPLMPTILHILNFLPLPPTSRQPTWAKKKLQPILLQWGVSPLFWRGYSYPLWLPKWHHWEINLYSTYCLTCQEVIPRGFQQDPTVILKSDFIVHFHLQPSKV